MTHLKSISTQNSPHIHIVILFLIATYSFATKFKR